MLTIKTNHHLYPLHSYADVLAGTKGKERIELVSNFDYLQEDDWSARLFRYKGDWYDAHEFESLFPTEGTQVMEGSLREQMFKRGWHGIQTSSVWTGIVITYPYLDPNEGGFDSENVRVGYAYWG